MKLVRWAVIVWMVAVAIIIGLFEHNSIPVTEVRTFCAYNRLFVEFEENGKKWGTMMLDYSGKPVPCSEDSDLLPNHIVTKERKLYDQSI